MKTRISLHLETEITSKEPLDSKYISYYETMVIQAVEKANERFCHAKVVKHKVVTICEDE